jgi:hypothetical protein
MISADEARKLKNKTNSLEDAQQLEKVQKLVEKDIKKGYTYYYGILNDSVLNELKRLGYDVDFSCNQMDGTITTIRW